MFNKYPHTDDFIKFIKSFFAMNVNFLQNLVMNPIFVVENYSSEMRTYVDLFVRLSDHIKQRKKREQNFIKQYTYQEKSPWIDLIFSYHKATTRISSDLDRKLVEKEHVSTVELARSGTNCHWLLIDRLCYDRWLSIAFDRRKQSQQIYRIDTIQCK